MRGGDPGRCPSGAVEGTSRAPDGSRVFQVGRHPQYRHRRGGSADREPHSRVPRVLWARAPSTSPTSRRVARSAAAAASEGRVPCGAGRGERPEEWGRRGRPRRRRARGRGRVGRPPHPRVHGRPPARPSRVGRRPPRSPPRPTPSGAGAGPAPPSPHGNPRRSFQPCSGEGRGRGEELPRRARAHDGLRLR